MNLKKSCRLLEKYMSIYIKLFCKYASFDYVKKLADSIKNDGLRHAVKKIFLSIKKYIKDQDFFILHKNEVVTILTPGHTYFVASLLKQALLRCNVSSNIVSDINHRIKSNIPYIVICPQVFKKLPRKRVIFFQMEQHTSRWFTKEYHTLLNNADIVFDYSIENIEKLVKENIPFSKIFYLPISFNPIKNCPSISERENDILFYGDISSPRRKKILDAIGNHYKIKIITDLFGEEIQKELLKSKIVLNIHYYQQSVLETTRLHEAISHGCIVISERSPDIDQYPLLKKVVNFVDADDVDGMISILDRLLKNENLISKSQERLLDIVEKTPNIFNFFFFRFLFYIGFIDFDKLYKELSTNLSQLSNRVCLSLPESTNRYKQFKNNNILGFDIFPGIRHRIGWIGCGLSYKFLLKYMAEKNYPFTIICEDDCEFPPNFSQRFDIVYKKILSNTLNWDIFSGFIADFSNDVNILDIETFHGETLVTIDRTVSTVFMIYSQKIYPIVDSWDYTNTKIDNTIDRFIERTKNLRIVITSPFLVGHQEQLHSTLWDVENSHYNDAISHSKKMLEEKVNEFRQGK